MIYPHPVVPGVAPRIGIPVEPYLITGYQDTFGSLYKVFRREYEPFSIVADSFIEGRDKAYAINEDGSSPANYKILRRVHPNTVHAAMKRGGSTKIYRLSPGFWYEVYGD